VWWGAEHCKHVGVALTGCAVAADGSSTVDSWLQIAAARLIWRATAAAARRWRHPCVRGYTLNEGSALLWLVKHLNPSAVIGQEGSHTIKLHE
jgi:hypothetical protein